MQKNRTSLKKRLLKLAIAAAFMVVAAAIIFLIIKSILPELIPIIRRGDREEIISYVRALGGAGGVAIIGLLQFIQVLSVVLPGAPIQLAAGVVYGVLPAFLICFIFYLLASLTVFLIAGKLGDKLDQILSIGGKNDKSGFIASAKHPIFMLFIAYVTPIIPTGILPYTAAKAKLKLKCFLAAAALGTAPSILITCISGNMLLKGEYLGAALLLGILGLYAIVLYVFRKRLERFVNRKLNIGECSNPQK